MTPFEEAGYTEDTKFRVVRDYTYLKKGDIVTLYDDDGSDCPWVITEDGRRGANMYLPGTTPNGLREELEVYKGGK